MRIGQIIKVIPTRKFGFIKSEHFRDDVFFHFSALQRIRAADLEVGQDVEFEIDELLRIKEKKLEATLVQYPSRPLTKTLDEMTIPHLKPSHHPRARQRKPTWRNKTTNDEVPNADPSESPPDGDSPTDIGSES